MSDIIYLNIWDDFDDNKTFAQVEGLGHLRDMGLVQSICDYFCPIIVQGIGEEGVAAKTYLHDTLKLYPEMTEQRCHNTGFKHYTDYKIELDGLTSELLERFVASVEDKVFEFGGYKVVIISES